MPKVKLLPRSQRRRRAPRPGRPWLCIASPCRAWPVQQRSHFRPVVDGLMHLVQQPRHAPCLKPAASAGREFAQVDLDMADAACRAGFRHRDRKRDHRAARQGISTARWMPRDKSTPPMIDQRKVVFGHRDDRNGLALVRTPDRGDRDAVCRRPYVLTSRFRHCRTSAKGTSGVYCSSPLLAFEQDFRVQRQPARRPGAILRARRSACHGGFAHTGLP